MPNQQEVFEAAHAHVAKWEGGYFDHPNDPGGVTMYGVSLMFLKELELWEGDIDGDGDIDRDDVLAVTKDTARDIFKRHFWDRPRAGDPGSPFTGRSNRNANVRSQERLLGAAGKKALQAHMKNPRLCRGGLLRGILLVLGQKNLVASIESK